MRSLEDDLTIELGSSLEVVNAAAGGVAATDHGVKTLGNKIAKLKPTNGDIVVFEFLSNSIIREVSSRIEPTSNPKRHHFTRGEFLSDSQLETCLNHLKKLLAYIPNTVSVCLLPPFPRYMGGGCCENPVHFNNYRNIANRFLGKGTDVSSRVFTILKKKYSNIFPVKYSDICGHDISKTEAKNFFRGLMSTDQVHFKEEAHRYWASAISRAISCLDASVPDVSRETSVPPAQTSPAPSAPQREVNRTSTSSQSRWNTGNHYYTNNQRNNRRFDVRNNISGNRNSFHRNRSFEPNHNSTMRNQDENLMQKVNQMMEFLKENQAFSNKIIQDQGDLIKQQEATIRRLNSQSAYGVTNNFNGPMTFSGPVYFGQMPNGQQ